MRNRRIGLGTAIAAAALPVALASITAQAVAQSTTAQTAAPAQSDRDQPPFHATPKTDKLELGKIENDSVDKGVGARRLYVLRGDANEPIQLDVTSDAIDSILEVYEEGGGQPILTDDDGGGRLNARITLPPKSKRPLIVAVRDANGRGGRFELRAGRVENHVDADLVPLTLDKLVSAALDERSARREGLDYPYARYSFSGRAGQRVQIDAHSEAFDVALELRFADKLIGVDTDSGPSTDARLIRRLTRNGDYTVWVLSPGKATGAYQLQVQQVTRPGVDPAVADIALGTSVNGMFDLSSPLRNDEAYALYRMHGKAGQTFRASLAGRDPTGVGRPPVVTLEAGVQTPAGFAVLENNGKAATTSNPGGPPASLKLAFREAGELLLRATGDLDWIGPYTLTLEDTTPAPAAPAPALSPAS